MDECVTPRMEAWQEVVALERQLHLVNQERHRIKGEIALRMEVIREDQLPSEPSV